jgi:hypothetical protein
MLKGTRNVLANECLEDEDRQVEDAVLDDNLNAIIVQMYF